MSQDQKEQFLELCRKFDNAMLVTRAEDGTIQARPMVVAKFESDGDLWFATDLDSGKVDEILNSSQVCVTLSGSGNYASISGVAEVVRDEAMVQQLWSEPWRVWFPDGPTDPRIALIKVHSKEGEYWSNSGTNGLKYLFQAAKAYATGQRPTDSSSSQHGRVKL